MINSLFNQGRHASPDLMNILFEPFHRWAAAQKKRFAAADIFVASDSFADDATLVAVSLGEAQLLISDTSAG